MRKGAVRMRVLEAHFGVERRTIRSWVHSGFLVSPSRGIVTIQSVNDFLASIAYNFGDQLPTWESLQNGDLVLLDMHGAAKELDLSVQQFKDAKWRLPIAYIKFPTGFYRYAQASLQTFYASLEPGLDAQLAAHIMGYRDLENLRTTAGLETTRAVVGKRGGELRVTEASFRRYLRDHLPPWIDVDDWIEECTLSPEPLMTVGEFQTFFPWSAYAIHRELQVRRGLYILRPNGLGMTAMISPQWVYEQLHWDRPLCSAEDLARIFGVGASTVYFWRASGYIDCPIPGHAHEPEDLFLWPLCWLAFLQNNASQELRPVLPALLHRALTGQATGLVSLGRMAEHTGRSRKVLLAGIHSGKVLAIRTPGGHFRVLLEWVR